MEGQTTDFQESSTGSPDTLTDRINAIANQLTSSHITLGELAQLVGRDGMMVLIIVLSLVFIIPVSIPGVSTIFGLAILTIAIGQLFGKGVWIPSKYRDRKIATSSLRPALLKSMVWLARLEKVSRPDRLRPLAAEGVASSLISAAMILAALLLMAPFGMIPLSNTLPAVALLFFAIGTLQRDGLCVLFGHLANVLTIVYFAALITGGALVIRETLGLM